MTILRPLILSTSAAALSLLLPAAFAAAPAQETVREEIRRELAEARHEVRAELANAKAELEAGNLDIGNSLRFGSRTREDADALPDAQITPAGDLLVEGVAVAIDNRQRGELLAYRSQVIDIALAGIEVGEHAALAAIDAVDRGMFRLVLSALSGRLQRRMEQTIADLVEPGVLRICDSLPALYATQQQLAASVPEFGPYATLDPEGVRTCEQDVRREFAGLGRG